MNGSKIHFWECLPFPKEYFNDCKNPVLQDGNRLIILCSQVILDIPYKEK